MNPRQFVKEYAIRSLVCCFSGGRDSLASTHYTLNELADIDDIDKYVVFVDTTVMVPTAVDFVKDVSAQLGWNLKILQPDVTFWDYAEKLGMPTIHRRWCCYRLKLKPIFDFIKPLKPQRAEVTGLRRDESFRRQRMNLRDVQHDARRGMHAWHYAPILDWTKKDVLRYLKKHDLPTPPHYRLGIKETCMCGAFATQETLMIVKAQFPELFQKFLDLEKRFRKGGACFFFQNRPTYAKDLAKQKTVEEWTK